jgi:hypothetical protein
MPPILERRREQLNLPSFTAFRRINEKLIYYFVLLLLLAFTACSEKDNPSEVKIFGYKLDQFINPDTVRIHIDPQADATIDFRSLFAYEIVSSTDGFSPRQSSYAGYELALGNFFARYYVPMTP